MDLERLTAGNFSAASPDAPIRALAEAEPFDLQMVCPVPGDGQIVDGSKI